MSSQEPRQGEKPEVIDNIFELPRRREARTSAGATTARSSMAMRAGRGR